ncbi:hypothetical protein HK405_011050, partial [Cladochytrium tenue]
MWDVSTTTSIDVSNPSAPKFSWLASTVNNTSTNQPQSASAPLKMFAGSCAVTLPQTNQALIIGGVNANSSAFFSALSPILWIYDPGSNSYAPVSDVSGTPPSPGWGMSCVSSADGNTVFVHGGCDPTIGSGAPTDPYLYRLDVSNIELGQAVWARVDSAAGSGPGPRCFGSSALYGDQLILFGGQMPGTTTSVSTATSTSSSRTYSATPTSDSPDEDLVTTQKPRAKKSSGVKAAAVKLATSNSSAVKTGVLVKKTKVAYSRKFASSRKLGTSELVSGPRKRRRLHDTDGQRRTSSTGNIKSADDDDESSQTIAKGGGPTITFYTTIITDSKALASITKSAMRDVFGQIFGRRTLRRRSPPDHGLFSPNDDLVEDSLGSVDFLDFDSATSDDSSSSSGSASSTGISFFNTKTSTWATSLSSLGTAQSNPSAAPTISTPSSTTSTMVSSKATSTDSPQNGLPPGVIAGVVLGCVAIAGALAAAAWLLIRLQGFDRRRRFGRGAALSPHSSPPVIPLLTEASLANGAARGHTESQGSNDASSYAPLTRSAPRGAALGPLPMPRGLAGFVERARDARRSLFAKARSVIVRRKGRKPWQAAAAAPPAGEAASFDLARNSSLGTVPGGVLPLDAMTTSVTPVGGSFAVVRGPDHVDVTGHVPRGYIVAGSLSSKPSVSGTEVGETEAAAETAAEMAVGPTWPVVPQLKVYDPDGDSASVIIYPEEVVESLQVDPEPVLERHATGRARVEGGNRYLDVESNTVIPLLAPIEESLEIGPDQYLPPKTSVERVAGEFESLIFDGLGDLNRLPLDSSIPGALGLEMASLPLRTYSLGCMAGDFQPGEPGAVQVPERLQAAIRFQCMYMHTPRAHDELLLRYGDVVVLRKFYVDGWAYGVNHTLRASGLLPIFVVEEAETQSSLSSSSVPSPPLAHQQMDHEAMVPVLTETAVRPYTAFSDPNFEPKQEAWQW